MTLAESFERARVVPGSLIHAAQEVSSVCRKGHADAEIHPVLARKRLTHGLHAFRYEVLEDGSCVALWANDPKGTVRIKAFPSLQEASLWTPRSER